MHLNLGGFSMYYPSHRTHPIPILHSVDEPDSTKIINVQANDGKSGDPSELSYTNYKVIGNGSFGVVFQAKLLGTGEYAAIKKVLQDKRFKVCAHITFLFGNRL